MIPGVIEGATRHLNPPPGWDEEKEGHCGVLGILDTFDHGHHRMISVWEPLPAEIAALVAGGRVELSVVGQGHPPVWLDVQAPFVGWKPPQGDRLADLVTILEGAMTPRSAVIWLGRPNPMLKGEVPLAMIMKGRLKEVLTYVRAAMPGKEQG